jgi:hypothetical protein
MTRAVFACLLAAALLALPGWTAGARGASCCGDDCAPCPLSFCKTTRADRALVPEPAALGPVPIALIRATAAAPFAIPSAAAVATFAGPGSFRPMRN